MGVYMEYIGAYISLRLSDAYWNMFEHPLAFWGCHRFHPPLPLPLPQSLLIFPLLSCPLSALSSDAPARSHAMHIECATIYELCVSLLTLTFTAHTHQHTHTHTHTPTQPTHSHTHLSTVTHSTKGCSSLERLVCYSCCFCFSRVFFLGFFLSLLCCLS